MIGKDRDSAVIKPSEKNSVDTKTNSEAKNEISAILEEPVTRVRSVGPAVASHLKKMDIFTVGDLLYHFPQRYLDPAEIIPVSRIKVGQEVIVVGVVHHLRKVRATKGTRILNVCIYDGTGYLYGTWFNQDFIADRLTEGTRVSFRGRALFRFGQLQIQNPLYDVLGDDKDFQEAALHTQKIVTFHPATTGLSSTQIRRIIKNAVDDYAELPEPLPGFLLREYDLIPRSTALRHIHFPSSIEAYQKARDRFIFEELFLMQIGLAARKKRVQREEKGIRYDIKTDLLDPFYKSLPFSLTTDQQKAIREIQKDMSRSHPMNRLLQGEVGSGKTVVALAALLTAAQGGYQGAIMAPTEILATQHYLKMTGFLKKLPVDVALLTGGQIGKEKSEILDRIGRGDIDIVIGTHTLIQEGVRFKHLGLVVIDEQHRFGVRQRLELKEKGPRAGDRQITPDVLIMTATPIPRTLSLTLYGDLDVSVLKQSPTGLDLSQRVATFICDQKHRQQAYERIKKEISSDHQAFIICPLIEESNKLKMKSVLLEAERLKSQVFPELRVGILHGRMKAQEREKVMTAFQQKRLDILISTTVIEVGIDIPSVSVILVEDADRYGLAQLHQLRGRVGRGRDKSYCFLFADLKTEEGKARMKAISNTYDGFKLADKDLEIRGEGQLFGEKQSGLPDLRLARVTEHLDTLLKAREAAFELVERDPELKFPEHRLILFELRRMFKQNFDWIFHA